MLTSPPPRAASDGPEFGCAPAMQPPSEAALRAAARQLAAAGDTEGMAAWLARDTAPSVRAVLFDGLVSANAAAHIRPYLGSADASLRNGAVAALKTLGLSAAGVLDDALCDPSADVRLLAVEVLRAWPPAQAVSRLQRVLLHDPHVNVCAAAAEVAAARGAPALAPALQALGRRFPDHAFMRFCAQLALARIGGDAATDDAATGEPAADDARQRAPRDVDLERFIELFYRHTGVRFAESQFYYLAKQLGAQAALRGTDCASYLAWLTTREPAAELAALVRRFCAPRALFFSPSAPPPVLAALLPRLSGDAPVWVMAQDEGQTAYSVALYREETGQGWPLTAQLRDTAAAGLYERAALSALAPAVAARWFSERDGSALATADRADPAGGASPAIDLWGEAPATASASAAQPDPVMLSPVIRAGVGTLALEALPQATMALIICDHVLVHEGEAARARLAERLYDALRPGGLLCLGTGETLSRASGLFNVITCAGGVAYQKPCDGP